jgi:SpoVK/Ycf46/Vps4 family AAA+-type ATPase
MTKNEFIKIGEQIIVKPKGADYDLIPGKVYDLSWNRWEDSPIFKENGELNLPKKVYSTKTDDIFKKRIITYFNKANTNTTGVMLAGTKGTGKTMLSKRIALESNLPIIVVATDYPADKLSAFFKNFTTPVVIMFDEIEKNDYWWETKDLLGFLDGVESTAKKLVLMTCNRAEKIDENFFDRCSRVRYFKQYEANSNSVFVRYMAEDKGVKNIDEVVNFINEYMKVKSFDNISAFLDEVVLFEDISLAQLAKDMNISTKEIKEKNENEEESIF